MLMEKFIFITSYAAEADSTRLPRSNILFSTLSNLRSRVFFLLTTTNYLHQTRMNMPLSFDDFTKALIAQLTDDELRRGVAYVAERRLPAGTKIQFPGTRIEVQTDSFLGFIDREPSANWGHSARYVIVNQESGEISSLEARLPPFRSEEDLRWRMAYQAPSVPDTAVEHPQ